jgi:phage protein D
MALDILKIEKQRQNFYAPAFNVVVGTASVVRDLKLEVTSVSVEMGVEGRADRFTFTINNAFDISKREFIKVGGKTVPEFFGLGLALEVHMGYGDQRHLDLMIAGIVTEFSTNFPSSGLPQLTVSGYDHSYCLTRGATSHNWGEGKTDSQVVKEVARKYNLQAKVQETSVVHDRIEQTQESAAAFLSRLAKRNSFEWFVREKELFFRKTANNEQGAIEMVWGQGLVSFSPEIDLSQQVSEVEVHGWNVQTKSPIVGRAKKGDEPGLDKSRASGKARLSGAAILAKICKEDQAVLKVRQAVSSQQEADLVANAILKQRSEMFVGGRGESIGIPEIRPNVNVTLKGLGDMFSKTFYVKTATHTVDTSGYHTTFEVKDPDL